MRILKYISFLLVFSCFGLSANKMSEENIETAISRGDVSYLKEHINKANVNEKDNEGNTPLAYWANGAKHDQTVLELLLRAGAEIALTSVIGGTLANFLLNDLGIFNIFLSVVIKIGEAGEKVIVKQIFGKKYEIQDNGNNLGILEVNLLDRVEELLSRNTKRSINSKDIRAKIMNVKEILAKE